MLMAAGGGFLASNVSATAQIRRICPFPSSIISPRGTGAARRWNPNSLPVISVATEPKSPANSPTLADRVRLGGLTEDGLSYEERIIVRSYEVGPNKTITIQIIASYLQDIACNHFLSLGYTTDDGFSTTNSMRKLNLILVLSRMHIELYKYPAWNDVIEIEAWVHIEGNMGFRRQWIIKDYSTGEVIGRATGKWLLMHQETRRFHKVVSEIVDECQIFTSNVPRYAFPDENKAWLKKIEKIDESYHYSKHRLEPRRTDVDMNDHLNYVTYIGWILESISEIINGYELQSLTIDFRQECRLGDIIDSLAIRESSDDHHEHNVNDGLLRFRHSLRRLSSNGSETTRARTVWRKKTEK
ncbi:hypothetical protein CASFOL_040259 [Castilleja foliolosa]|uniref:Acyl-[acyl-carrier-protein] hydrolase n=1 Tax=Castilleja foliolosa TaxID=1961234 RepID=A0ABD3BEY4_9LAMI